MEISENDYLEHYGTPRRSGRYPWGSGDNTESRRTFLEWIKDMLGKGFTQKEVAEGMNMSLKEMRSAYSAATEEIKAADIAMAQALSNKGNSNIAIAERMGIPESTVRSYLKPGAELKYKKIEATAKMLKEAVDKDGFIDVGGGTEQFANVSRDKMDAALFLLNERDGYPTYTNIPVKQLGTQHETNMKVLTPPGTEWADVRYNTEKIRPLGIQMDDTGLNSIGLKKPKAISEDRIKVNYKEDGGHLEDGVMYIRPGVEDLSLGGKNYAQVRIQVGKEHYLKGMAIYKDDLPEGADIVFNTNKSKKDAPNKLDVLKPVERIQEGPNKGKVDPDNPFGAQIRKQILDENGNVKSAVNIVTEQNQWADWKDRIASQVLSKQKPKVAQEQLDMLYERRQNELDEIMALTNPTVKKKLLKQFSESVDAQAVSLEAAAMPRQAWHAILPENSLKPTEIYAPGYQNGEKVALIRYPHGGKFEIPELVVNNKNRNAKKLLGNARDAVAINAIVAEQLSGADFDGDTVLVIPNDTGRIKSSKPLQQLKNFDHKAEYPKYEGMKRLSKKATQKEMGTVSNLITDMTIRGASEAEIARAVKHSMVVIDAHKHELNYKLSYERNGIKALQEKYQPKVDGKGGSSTIISRATGDDYRPKEKPRPAKLGGPVNKKTGELEFVPTGETSYKTGKPKLENKPRLARVRDARELSSGTRIENIYADHSNRMKSLANTARKSEINTPRAPWSPSAKKTYAKEVSSLNAKVALAEERRPRERAALVFANATVKAKKDANPSMTAATEKKLGYQALAEARARFDSKKRPFEITDKEWEAIQSNALSDSNVEKVLRYADPDKVREMATPKTRKLMTSAKSRRAQTLLSQGYTREEVARQLGVSVSTLDRSIDGE